MLVSEFAIQKSHPKAVKPDIARYTTYKLGLYYMVSGFQIAGGLAGYFKVGTIDSTKNT